MKQLKLSTKFLLISGFILFIFCLASFGILFRAQSHLALQEMDHLLKNETLALSALVNATRSENFEFEISPHFLARYDQHNPHGFFRFFDPRNNQLLRESSNAPAVTCSAIQNNHDVEIGGRLYRVESFRFSPEFDGDEKNPPMDFVAPPICLVVGIDEAPYNSMIVQTLASSVPILILIVVLLIGAMLVVVRSLTRDLSTLTKSLATTDFSATHSFPTLPVASTSEVKAVTQKLESLHSQAADVYKEMWLFLGRAAHQIKTPVTAMQATLEVLLRKERSKEELLAGLEDVKSAMKHLNVLTKKLISSSRISYQEAPPTEAIDLKIIFSDLLGLFKSQAEECGVELRLASTSTLKVIGNYSLLSDIFGNLIENAILYSPKSAQAKVTIEWSTVGENAAIQINDQGPGFPPENISTLFDPFMRGDERVVAGSGLGLSIAKKSAHLLGGDVELKESTALGSKVIVTLPFSP